MAWRAVAFVPRVVPVLSLNRVPRQSTILRTRGERIASTESKLRYTSRRKSFWRESGE